MSLDYYGVCQDCKQYVELEKFCSWAAYRDESSKQGDLEEKEVLKYVTFGFVHKSLRLHQFMFDHQGHRVGVFSENETDCWFDDSLGYREVASWDGFFHTNLEQWMMGIV